jgi:DNA-binding NtrC family response regulator
MNIDSGALDLLAAYPWPGNVRELQNICERAVVLTPTGTASPINRQLIEPWLTMREAPHAARLSSLTEAKPGGLNGTSGHAHSATDAVLIQGRTLEDIERDAVVSALYRFNGHRQRTATSLGIGVRTLGLKLKKWKELKLVEASL